MTLTTNDLQKIKKVVKNEIKPVKSTVSGLKKGQTDLKLDFSTLKKGQVGLKSDLDSLKKGQKRIEKKSDKMFNFLDKDHAKLVERVVKIENHLRIPTPEFS